jgi:hypothetical protein
LRKDGKFIGIDGSIPEGQGIVMAHLNECHELLEMVRPFECLFLFLFNSLLQLKQSMDINDDDEEEELTEDDDGLGQGSSATTESED